jgi:hypothetical protein
MSSLDDLAQRKALLVAQAELERLRLTQAFGDARGIISPARDPDRAARRRPLAMRLIGFAVPMLGLTRAAGLVRGLSLGLTAYRLYEGWRGRSRR